MQLKVERSFIRYIIVGGSAFAIEYLSYLFLLKALKFNYVTASIIVYSVIFWFVFYTNRRWSFQSDGAVLPQLVKYLLLFAFNNLVGNILLLRFLTETLKISDVISPIIKMACIVIWNYFIYKHIIYRSRPNEDDGK